jgi:flagellar hook assembly protein FlgD
LRPNYPNPFNPETNIVYGIPPELDDESRLVLEVYDLRGERVRQLPPESGAGWHTVRWDGCDDVGSPRPSGQYLIRLACGPTVKTWKMTMVK